MDLRLVEVGREEAGMEGEEVIATIPVNRIRNMNQTVEDVIEVEVVDNAVSSRLTLTKFIKTNNGKRLTVEKRAGTIMLDAKLTGVAAKMARRMLDHARTSKTVTSDDTKMTLLSGEKKIIITYAGQLREHVSANFRDESGPKFCTVMEAAAMAMHDPEPGRAFEGLLALGEI